MKSGVRSEKVIRVSNAVAAGQTAINCTPVDMAEAESVEFLVLWGAITAGGVQSVKAQQDTAVGMGSAADLLGSKQDVADTDDNLVTRMEIIKPEERFVRCVISRATQNSAIDGVIAILRYPRVEPVVQDATVQGTPEVMVSPIEGTA